MTGEPVIVADLTGAITHSIELLLVAVLLVLSLIHIYLRVAKAGGRSFDSGPNRGYGASG